MFKIECCKLLSGNLSARILKDKKQHFYSKYVQMVSLLMPLVASNLILLLYKRKKAAKNQDNFFFLLFILINFSMRLKIYFQIITFIYRPGLCFQFRLCKPSLKF